MLKLRFSICLLLFVNLFAFSSAHAIFGMFEKKEAPKRVEAEKLSEEDKIGYVDRTEKDITKLKSVKLFVPDALDDNSVFKIKSVLQDNDSIYKVVQTDLKNYIVYFDEGKEADSDLVLSLITAAGYNPQIK